jgi:hypothetical protein
MLCLREQCVVLLLEEEKLDISLPPRDSLVLVVCEDYYYSICPSRTHSRMFSAPTNHRRRTILEDPPTSVHRPYVAGATSTL